MKTEGMAPREILATIWGHDAFRGDQEAIVSQVIAGNDTIVLKPTGGGKSLCYQLPALAMPGCAIILSPLISLMQNQVEYMKEKGAPAEKLNSDMPKEEQEQVLRDVRAGKIKMLYVSPERFVVDSFLSFLEETDISLIAVDEAHCVSQWGHDFRKDYVKAGGLLAEIAQRRKITRVAATASASPDVLEDIKTQLQLERALVFASGFDRPNINYAVEERRDNYFEQLLEFLTPRKNETGIVYCLSRKRTDQVTQALLANGFNAIGYHAGMSKEERAENLSRFLHEEAVVAVATVAFGMGIDRPDVRFVVHVDAPDSIESYYQETGRAGRDDKPAEALMLFSQQSIETRKRMVSANGENQTLVDRGMRRLNGVANLARTTQCRRRYILEYFGERPQRSCDNCDNCLGMRSELQNHRLSEFEAKFLWTLHSAGENFGISYIADIICGNRTPRNVPRGHDRLPCFGCGENYSKEFWMDVGKRLYADGYIEKASAEEPRSGFVLSENGRKKYNEEGEGVLSEAIPKSATPYRLSPEEDTLYNRLCAVMIYLASKKGVPPNSLVSRSVLREIATTMPDSMQALSRVRGMTFSKLHTYGEPLLEVVGKYKAENSLDSVSISW
jgi:ATP-dependent DNA helicase RecQ